MPVIPCRVNLFQCDRELYQILLNCQEQSLRQGNPLIVSLSQAIDPIDPLAVLQTHARDNAKAFNFYWENPTKQEAIATLGSVESLTLARGNRFRPSKQFIEDCLQKIIKIGDLDLPRSGPHFFSSFTFFEEPANRVASPFPAATLFLPQFQVSRHHNRSVFVTNFSINPQIDLEFLLDKLKHDFKRIRSATPPFLNLGLTSALPRKTRVQVNPAYQFTSAVASALKSIDNGQFSKIVLAHTLDVIASAPFHLAASLDNLRQCHPDCYIFSVGNGRGCNFIGASPERLISIHKGQLVTDALAGSAPRGMSAAQDAHLANQLLKSEKERREHQAVSDFIQQCLRELGLKPTRSPLQLLQLSNIQHLWTTIQAQLPGDVHPLDIVARLHPTPAVAGVPTQVACEQIRHYEAFDRSLYAGPLGWLDHRGNGEFIVGIRSASIEGDRARLYAGAGIVAGSNPDKELAEVQLKLQTMLKALV